MATGISIFCRFSDNSYGYLQNADVTAGATGEEILTSNAGGALNQTSGVSVGQSFQGKVMTHALMKVETQNAATGSYLAGYLLDPAGNILVAIQGGGGVVADLPKLCKPVRMSSGVRAWGAWQAQADSATLVVSLVCYCASGKTEIFQVSGVDTTSTELVSQITGASFGNALANETVVKFFAVYPSSVGMNNQLGGVSAVWVTSPEGQLKALIPPASGGATGMGSLDTQWIHVPFRVSQNDQAWVNTDT